jgi:hypothetical protein
MKFHLPYGSVSTILDAPRREITPEALGSKLANIIRFQGQPRALSVVQHQMLTYRLAQLHCPQHCGYALVHDVAESLTGDCHGLYKTDDFRAFERRVEADLGARGWVLEHTPELKQVDMLACDWEKWLIWGGVFPNTSTQERTFTLLSARARLADWLQAVYTEGMFG